MSESMLSDITIMVPPYRPDLDLDSEIRKMKKRIKKNGLMGTVDEILEEYHNWANDFDLYLINNLNKEQEKSLYIDALKNYVRDKHKIKYYEEGG